MDKNRFKNLFNELAQKNGFERAFGMWFKQQEDSLVVVDLQRSNYSNLYYVNINVYIQGFFGKTFSKSKELKYGAGGAAIFTRSPKEYNDALDQENHLSDSERKGLLEKMFSNFLLPFIEKTSTREKLIVLHKNEGYFLLPTVKKELSLEIHVPEESQDQGQKPRKKPFWGLFG